VIVDGPPALSADESTDIPLADLREILRSRGIEALRDEWRRNPLATLRTKDRRMHELLDVMIARYSGTDLAGSAESAAPAARLAPAARPTSPGAAATNASASPRVPLLVLNGEHDLETRRRAGQALSQTSPFTEYALVPEAGHLPNLDNPHAYNETIRSFLARHLPRESLP
jgi:pimeloyl-ACP methyl ester carboxylesterase